MAVAPEAQRSTLHHKSASPPRRGAAKATAAALDVLAAPPALLQRLGAALGQAQLGERALVGALAGGLAGGVTNGLLVRRLPLRWRWLFGSDSPDLALPLPSPFVGQHPLDTIKVKLQLRGSTFSGPLQVVRHAVATHSVGALWHGWGAAWLGSSLSSSVFFGAYETCKACGAPPPVATLVGNALSSLILVPKELVKSRLQAGAQGNTLHVLATALRTGGVAGLYSGYMSTLLRNAPSNVISFSAFEALKHAQLHATAAQRRRGEDTLSPGASLVTGAAAGALAATMTHPLDLVKTRLMTQGVKGPSGVQLYRGVASTLRTVARDEGLRGLGRGLRVRLFYNALFTAFGLTCFEAFKRAIRAELAKRKRRAAPRARVARDR